MTARWSFGPAPASWPTPTGSWNWPRRAPRRWECCAQWGAHREGGQRRRSRAALWRRRVRDHLVRARPAALAGPAPGAATQRLRAPADRGTGRGTNVVAAGAVGCGGGAVAAKTGREAWGGA